jgi:uncharacterized protein
MQKYKYSGFASVVVILIVIAAFVGYTIYSSLGNRSTTTSLVSVEDLPKTSKNTQEELLFEELTIPYLRQKQYNSLLGDRIVYQKNASYTSYLTTYDSDGLKINGLLTIPGGEMPDGGWPAIVFVHGYIAPTIYETTTRYVEYVNSLARNGFVVFKIDLRGHGNSEGEAGGAYYSSDYVVDTLHAYSALQSSEFVNSNRIGLWGHSMAGNVVMRSLATKPDIPAVVVWAGAGYTYSDLLEYQLNDQSYRPPTQNTERQRRRQALRDEHGEFSPESDFWKLVVPTNYLGDVKGSIQLHHAIDDSVVSVEYSRNLSNILGNTPIPHELYEYQTGGHNIVSPSFGVAMQRTVDFYRTYLK